MISPPNKFYRTPSICFIFSSSAARGPVRGRIPPPCAVLPSEWRGRGGRSQPERSDFRRFRPVCRRNFWSRAPMTMRPRTARGRIVPWGVCDFGGPGPRGCCVLPAKTRSFSRPFWPIERGWSSLHSSKIEIFEPPARHLSHFPPPK